MRDKLKGTREHNTEIRGRILYMKVGRVKELEQKALLLTEHVHRTRFVLEPPQQRGLVARGFVEMPKIPPKQGQGSSKL